MSALRGVSVVIAGAGLAGLTAGHELMTKGAAVSIIDARGRVGGRVLTERASFRHRQHAEAGGDLIDEDQLEIRRLAGELGLKLSRILRGGFTGVRKVPGRRLVPGRKGWQELERRLGPEIRAFCLSERRWDGAVARAIGRQSVASWLDRVRAPRSLREVAVAMRGFFLADPDELSLIAMVDQFADEGPPGGGRTFRVLGGNDRIADRLARRLGSRLQLDTVLRRIVQSPGGIRAAVETRHGLEERAADYAICAMPTVTLRDVAFEPSLPDLQREAVQRLKYGAVTKTALQFRRPLWRKRGKPRAFGTNLTMGAVWDGNEEQRGEPGILTFMAGGRASAATRGLLESGGPQRLMREVDWLDLDRADLLAWNSVTWEHDPWARGGYAFFDHQYDPALREWLARPFGRVFFAGEHTSLKWQGYMNGAVESGLRAAAEICAAQST